MDKTNPRRLVDLPLWRLIVMLDDVERLVGADSESARAIADAVRAKLRCDRSEREEGTGRR